MATINDVYTHLKTLTKKWFYDKTEIDDKLEGNAQQNIAGKVDKVSGKGLSTNDYTTTEKDKLAGIEAEANKTVVDSTLSTASSNPVRNSAVAQAINGKASKSHASTANTYGLGTTSDYGHVKTINGLTQSSHQNGTALSAYQGKILNDAIDGKVDKVTGKGLSTNDFTDTYKNKIDQLDEDLSSINLNWDNITQKPSSYPPTTHQHDASDVFENDNSNYRFLTVSTGTTQHNINLSIDNALDTYTTSKANQSDLTALTSRVSALETSEFQIVFKSSKNALPATGRANTLYYVSNSGSGENTYDEYTWVAADNKYELVGSKEIDLSGYVQKTNLITEIDTIIQSLNAIQE